MSSPQQQSVASAPKGIGRESLNLPNLITTSRLLLAFVLFTLISLKGWWITSAALFVLAASTDALDGYLARRFRQITVLGRILDPFVDKVIVCGTFVFLLEHRGPEGSGI
ncbi:MAG: CDP-alcohol phosphatidyltransferase family protein, partial [Planctomycetaceae bacterium]|nr:CDP-alcohol phosphatidyltransferase family protein [Planctomycetaceae bacterium]